MQPLWKAESPPERAYTGKCKRIWDQPPQVRIGPQSMWTKFERE